MSQQLVGVTPSPPLPVPEQPSTLNQETIPTTSKGEPTIGSQTNTVTPQDSPQSPEPAPETPQQPAEPAPLLPPVPKQPLNQEMGPTIATNALTPVSPSPPQSSPLPPDRTPLPFVGFVGFLQPFRDFLQDHKRDWRRILVWFGFIVLVAVSMGVSIGFNSRDMKTLGGAPCNKTGVGSPRLPDRVVRLNDIPRFR